MSALCTKRMLVNGHGEDNYLSAGFYLICLIGIFWLSYLTLRIVIDPSAAFARVALRGAEHFSEHASVYGVVLLRFQPVFFAVAAVVPLLAAGLLFMRKTVRPLLVIPLLLVLVAEFGFVTLAILSST